MVAAALSAMLPAQPVIFDDHETQYCSVVIHNLSSLGVVAYVLVDGEDPKEGIASSREIYGTAGRPVVAARGDSPKELFTFGQAAKLPAQPQRIIVAAAIFTDGSYERDVRVAAKLKAPPIEARTVYSLMKPVIDHVVRDQPMNDETRTVRITDEICRPRKLSQI
jgi:hypothetical protein